jgi:hypothetical protein
MTNPTWLGPIRQSAFIVDDIDAAAMEWVRTQGVGPFFAYEVEFAETTYRGRTVPMRAGMALAQSGGQQIELIAPDRAQESIYTEYLDAGGTGLQHVCYWADVDRAIAHFEQLGCVLVQDGVTGNANRFAYLTGAAGVPYVELVNPRGGMATFFESIAAAAVDWDGTDPVRR